MEQFVEDECAVCAITDSILVRLYLQNPCRVLSVEQGCVKRVQFVKKLCLIIHSTAVSLSRKEYEAT